MKFESYTTLIEYKDKITVSDSHGRLLYTGEFGEMTIRTFAELKNKSVVSIDSIINEAESILVIRVYVD